MATRAAFREGWKRSTSGLVRGTGIPAPSGSFTVGCVDLVHKFEDEPNSLLVRLFYPCDRDAEAGGYQYTQWNPHERYITGIFHFLKATSPRFKSSLAKRFSDILIPALWEAPFLKSAVCPLVVFSHGLGGIRTDCSGLCCDLASHGYVVGAIEHRDRSACVSMSRVPKPGGREGELQDDWLEHYHLQEGEKEFPVRLKQVKQRAVDARRTLDLMSLLNDGGVVGNMLGVNFDFSQFKGRMDIATAAIIGHSFGGATTIQTLSEDRRFRCGVGLDTWMGPIHRDIVIAQPLIFINSSMDFQWKENIQKMIKLTKPTDNLGRSAARIITLKCTTHLHQTDHIFVYPELTLNQSEPVTDPTLAYTINLNICHAFLRRHLLQDSAYQGPIPNLDGSEGHSEHILFGTNVDISDNEDKSLPKPVLGADHENHKSKL